MTAALAVMKKTLEKGEMDDFIKKHGIIGFAHTQGHIPSGVPFIGIACDHIRAGTMKRVMIIGKGSLFLARLTNLADGASFLIEPPDPSAPSAQGTSGKAGTGEVENEAIKKEEIKSEVKAMILEALSEIAGKLG
jgi:betaine reductase